MRSNRRFPAIRYQRPQELQQFRQNPLLHLAPSGRLAADSYNGVSNYNSVAVVRLQGGLLTVADDIWQQVEAACIAAGGLPDWGFGHSYLRAKHWSGAQRLQLFFYGTTDKNPNRSFEQRFSVEVIVAPDGSVLFRQVLRDARRSSD